ncbi:unnamed protein product [Polarella glacialis]|uniref:Uncharacterized protein n=1 Tax=Polarella glacialis TaxID=89957 RepID=A0A813I7U6_POLGL|nr:unnamed protein product [Polarella glacialis]
MRHAAEPNSSCPKTLADVLAGLLAFASKVDDCEASCVQRVRSIFPAARRLSFLVRQAEGILSKAALQGLHGGENRHNTIEHIISLARIAIECSAAKQTRFALWANFSTSCSQFASNGKASKGKKAAVAAQTKANADVAQPVLFFLTPSSVDNETSSCARRYQVLVVRPDATQSLRFALVAEVWRGGIHHDTARTAKKLVPIGPLPAECAVTIRAVLLMPAESGSLVCSCLSPVVMLDAHDGSIMFEIPSASFEASECSTGLTFKLVPSAWAAFSLAGKCLSQIEPVAKLSTSSSSAAGSTTRVFVETDFKDTAAGKANMQTFFQCMREAWESMHHPLVDQVGYVQLSKTERVLWAELSARLPLYIAKKWQAASAGAKTVGRASFKWTSTSLFGVIYWYLLFSGSYT